MKHPFTTTLNTWAIEFLKSQAKKEKTDRNDVLEAALKMYKKAKLKREVEEGLADRQDEYREITNEFASAQMDILLRNEYEAK